MFSKKICVEIIKDLIKLISNDFEYKCPINITLNDEHQFYSNYPDLSNDVYIGTRIMKTKNSITNFCIDTLCLNLIFVTFNYLLIAYLTFPYINWISVILILIQFISWIYILYRCVSKLEKTAKIGSGIY